MRLTFLGTGSAMPTGTRAQSGYLLRHGDETLLVDCGSGVLNALARTDVGYEGVDTVVLTHHHLDHVSDLAVLLKARWLAGETDLTVVGPPGTSDLVEETLAVHEYMQGRLDLTLRDRTTGTFDLAGFTIESMAVRHSMQCFAYRLQPADGGPSVVLSGDTEAFPELIEFADGAAVLVHDCSFPDDVDVSNHPTPTTLGEALAAAEAELGRVYLTHLYPHTEGRHEEMLASLADHYDGQVTFAEDGLTVRVED
ncbi:MBL fold metallo-hydrolase [Halomicroarcula sp. GCM10025709]|uniref:MBL fold metallo-hydrolase n=1 Tax=Haloarcula TaxID=2237 RepID=UPI0024C43F13|nr:MBL fold metallo-hydrolase [Halomicroarcula sp. YJ-61-S]